MRHPLIRALGLLLICSIVRADVYRCEGVHGEPSFSQSPCGRETERVLQERAAAVPPSGLRAGETAWLQERRRERQAGAGVARRSQPGRRGAADRQAYQCLRRQRALDAVNADLRRGYRAGRGEKLRRRRQAHEDYLAAHCR